MSSQRFTEYLTEIARTPLLSASEEIELGTCLRTRPDTPEAAAAREHLIAANLKLVVSIANNHSSLLPIEELVAEGNLGLIKAVDRYDPTRFQNRFSTYATWWITQFIRQAVNRAHMIRTPLRRVTQLTRIQQAHSYCDGATQQDIPRIVAETGLSEQDVRHCLANRCQTISLQHQAFEGADEAIEAIIPSEHCTVAPIMAEEDMRRMQEGIFTCLSVQERDIILRRFGLGCPPETLEDLTKTHGVSRECIRQMQERAIRTLRNFVEELPVAVA
jgi:RNA polymerase primary sigma factor